MLEDDDDTDRETPENDTETDAELQRLSENPAAELFAKAEKEKELDNSTPKSENPDFYRNLALDLSDSQLASIASELDELLELDIEARSERDSKYAEGLQRTGLGDEAPGGAKFRGASKVVHPMMVTSSIDFSSRAMQELFPRTSGPVRDKIIGKVTQEKVDAAKRKTRFFNWQLTEEMPEFRGELEQAMSQVPFGGAHYLKFYFDDLQQRTRPLFIAIDDVILPYSADSFMGAERVAHRQIITRFERQRRESSGFYRKVPFGSAMVPDETKSRKAANKIDGNKAPVINRDGLGEIFEVQCYWTIEELDEGSSPYLITIERENGKAVLAIYRNWDPDDPLKLPLPHIVEFPFIPFRGAYPLGLPHLIGGLSASATGALRALLDAAHISNTQAALKLRGGTRGGQNLAPAPGEIKEIEGATVSTDPDIRKVVMPLPFPQPSNVLFQLLGFLVESGEGVIRTTFEDIPDQTTQMPVGTTLALIEQGMVVFSSIHARLHDAFGRALKILHRLNKENITEKKIEDEFGELLVRREDFEGPMDVVPISDPNVFSQVQRASQTALIAQRQTIAPGLYDPRAVEERILEDAKIPNAKALLVPKPEPKNLNAVNENLAASRNTPIVVFPEQDHLAHIQIHADFLTNPVLGANPLLAPIVVPSLIHHITDHMTMQYAKRIHEVVSEQLGMDPSDLMKMKDNEIDGQLEQLLALASQKVQPEMIQMFQGLQPIIAQAQQMMQSLQPPPPMDPAQAQLQIAAMADKREGETNQLKGQEMAARIQGQQEGNIVRLKSTELSTQTQKEIAAQREAAENARTIAETQAKREMNQEDNATALIITEKELAHDAKTNLKTGTGINPQP